MTGSKLLRVRRSLQDDYTKGNKKPLEDLMRAWKGIKELPPDNSQSFFVIGGYHGEPFRGAGWEAFLLGRLLSSRQYSLPHMAPRVSPAARTSLQSIPGCADVMLPIGTRPARNSLKNGIPWA